jgi:glyoxylase-like metal-dependent hydrolase (beta-lactamase superfamily II)
MTPPLNVNVFTAPEKPVVGERPRPFGPPLAWDAMTSTLIFGEHDAVLVDTLTTIAEAEALASWVALHHRNLTTVYITHGHIDHFAGLNVLLQRFPKARAIATPKSVELMHTQVPRQPFYRVVTGQDRRWRCVCGSEERERQNIEPPPSAVPSPSRAPLPLDLLFIVLLPWAGCSWI